jgi:hypothetical protein
MIVVPTSDPAATESEYRALGWTVLDLLANPFYARECAGKPWALRLWRPEAAKQPECCDPR